MDMNFFPRLKCLIRTLESGCSQSQCNKRNVDYFSLLFFFVILLPLFMLKRPYRVEVRQPPTHIVELKKKIYPDRRKCILFCEFEFELLLTCLFCRSSVLVQQLLKLVARSMWLVDIMEEIT